MSATPIPRTMMLTIYGDMFLKFIRKEIKFNNVNQLRAQIKKDLNIAKNTK